MSGSGTSNAVLWVYGDPGSGKSILCSHAIQTIQETKPSAGVSFHFCQFDRFHSALETLRGLANTLFEQFWGRVGVSGTSTGTAISASLPPLVEELRTKTACSSSNEESIRDFLKVLIKGFDRTYILIDGLDEECEASRWPDFKIVLETLLPLVTSSEGSFRLWISSQDRATLREEFKTFPSFDIKYCVSRDVELFLARRLNAEGEISREELDSLLDHLKMRAEGNFLWASMMIKMISEASSMREMRRLVKDGPRNLDDYYRKIIMTIEKQYRTLARYGFSYFFPPR